MFNQKLFLIAALGITVTGCSLTPLQGDFSCPYKDGTPCLSISQADKRTVEKIPDETKWEKCCAVSSAGSEEWTEIGHQPPSAPFPYRKSDKIARIWMAPFEDADGNWHADSYVYAVTEQSKWMPRGVKTPEGIRGSFLVPRDSKEKNESFSSRTTNHEERITRSP